ncbi:uncharacterized protein TNCV_617151 [Trichonephila clavipes]|nr:uncharacterized protein TNCV_617151 [Trichonephila clavipes]
MAVNDRTGSSRLFAARWSIDKSFLMSASSIHRRLLHLGLRPGKRIGTKLSFQTNHASMCWAMMATFVLEALPVNAAFQSTFSGLTPGVVVWGTISYHKRSNLIRIEGNLNINRDVHEVLQS